MFHDHCGGHDASQSVVVRRGDRIELVVVTTGATNRQAQNRTADRIELLVRHVHASFLGGITDQDFRTEHKEAGGEPLAVALCD